MVLLNSIVSWINIKRLHAIDLFKVYPVNTQEETFYKLIRKAESTVWGKKYDYKTIDSIQKYQDRVPLQSYDDVKPYVDRLMRGEQNLLWPTEVKWFAKSSGTTHDKSKFIPVSREAMEDCHFRGGKDIISLYTTQFPVNNLLTGKALTIGGSHQVSNYNTNAYFGDLSAIIIENLPFWVEFIRTPSAKVALIPDFEEKVTEIAKVAVNEDVTSIAGVPSWNLIMLKKILEFTGKNNILDVWPNLELFSHGGVSFKPYREQFKEMIPTDNMHYFETYNASEGFFGLQDDPETDDMLLMLDYGIFYEFIPLEEIDDDEPTVFTIADVKLNKIYAMVISTNAGLWRYIIGDTIIFTSLFPHKIKISGRTRQYINVFGEELMVDNAEQAVAVACQKTGALVKEYTAGPVYMEGDKKGAHEWIIEFEKIPANLDAFFLELDSALKKLNSDYEAKRYKDITLGFPKFNIARKNLFYDWMKSRGKIGGQNKVPRLANDRKYLDQLLKMK